VILIFILSTAGCIDGNEDGGDGEGGDIQRAHATILGRDVDSWLYILQNISISEIRDTDYDLVVMDYSADGNDTGAFSGADIQSLKDSGKIVVSYMSIGEAEDYRFYWQENWTVGNPEFIDSENLEWEGNYKVHYWEREWQDIIYSGNDSYLDKIISAGFNGVYLDIIDAYEYYEEKGRATAAQEMVDFVLNLTRYARERVPDFLVIPQNGEGLVEFPEYLENISGQAKEDLFFVDDERQDTDERDYSLGLLHNVTGAGKFVLSVDYPAKEENVKEYYRLAFEEGFLAFAGNRALDRVPGEKSH